MDSHEKRNAYIQGISIGKISRDIRIPHFIFVVPPVQVPGLFTKSYKFFIREKLAVTADLRPLPACTEGCIFLGKHPVFTVFYLYADRIFPDPDL